MIAADLVAWTMLLTLADDSAGFATCGPNALPYSLIHAQARLTRDARQRSLKIPKGVTLGHRDRRDHREGRDDRGGQHDQAVGLQPEEPGEPQHDSGSRRHVILRRRHRQRVTSRHNNAIARVVQTGVALVKSWPGACGDQAIPRRPTDFVSDGRKRSGELPRRWAGSACRPARPSSSRPGPGARAGR